MRTTNPDVELLVRKAIAKRGLSFKETINTAIRKLASEPEWRRNGLYTANLRSGAEQCFRWDKALATASAMEDEVLVGKLSMKK